LHVDSSAVLPTLTANLAVCGPHTSC
jgi:hypothetical protein